VEGRGPVALIEAAAAAGSVTRIVLLSSRQDGSQRAKNHLLAENALRSSGIPYLIVRVPSLVDEQGGLNTILLDQSEGDQEPAIGNALARVDAAQVVCQSFVYDRTVRSQEASSPPSSTRFRNVVMDASNIEQPVVLDTRKWSDKFASLQEVKR
jgi:NAD(P)H-binding